MDSWLLLFFFLPFHLVGAFVLVLMLRQWQEQDLPTQIFTLVWSLFFLGIPFFMQAMAAPHFLLVTVPLTVGLPFLFWWAGDTLRAAFRQPRIPVILGVSAALYFEVLIWGLLEDGGELPPGPLVWVVLGALTLGLLWLLLYNVLQWWRWWQAESDSTDTDAV